jgi:hypothetical protein
MTFETVFTLFRLDKLVSIDINRTGDSPPRIEIFIDDKEGVSTGFDDMTPDEARSFAKELISLADEIDEIS